MLGSTFKECYDLRLEMIDVYWILLTPVTIVSIILEFYNQTLNFREITKRIFLSAILLVSFEYTTELIASMSDGIVKRLGGLDRLPQVLNHIVDNFGGQTPSLMQFQQLLLFFINMVCYFLVLLSFYLIELIAQFIYAILYVISPLMLLCLVPSGTQHIAGNLYKGIIKIAIWRIVWSVLGVMLIEFIKSPMADIGSFLLIAVTNIFIAFAMLVVPFFTSSLLADGGGAIATQAMSFVTSPVINKIKAAPKAFIKGARGELKRNKKPLRKNSNSANGCSNSDMRRIKKSQPSSWVLYPPKIAYANRKIGYSKTMYF